MFKYLKGIKKDIRENNTFEMDVNQDKKTINQMIIKMIMIKI